MEADHEIATPTLTLSERTHAGAGRCTIQSTPLEAWFTIQMCVTQLTDLPYRYLYIAIQLFPKLLT